jgi:two-component system LytT family response regulator
MDKMINMLMVDRDEEQLEKMGNIIASSEQHYDFYAATTAREGLELLEQHKMELIILEIGLPDQSGLELAQQIREIPGYEFVWIIFLSAHQHHETEAFKKTHCYDYILKPYDAAALFRTIEMLSRYKTTTVTDEERQFVVFKQRDRYIRLLTKDILYIEVIGNNSTLYTYSKVYCLKRMSLKKLQLMLPNYFVQCHKSFIVNRNYIELIQRGPYGWEIKLKNYSRSVPNGDKYKDNITNFAEIS